MATILGACPECKTGRLTTIEGEMWECLNCRTRGEGGIFIYNNVIVTPAPGCNHDNIVRQTRVDGYSALFCADCSEQISSLENVIPTPEAGASPTIQDIVDFTMRNRANRPPARNVFRRECPHENILNVTSMTDIRFLCADCGEIIENNPL